LWVDAVVRLWVDKAVNMPMTAAMRGKQNQREEESNSAPPTAAETGVRIGHDITPWSDIAA
jgi:hypothetical protein